MGVLPRGSAAHRDHSRLEYIEVMQALMYLSVEGLRLASYHCDSGTTLARQNSALCRPVSTAARRTVDTMSSTHFPRIGFTYCIEPKQSKSRGIADEPARKRGPLSLCDCGDGRRRGDHRQGWPRHGMQRGGADHPGPQPG